MLPLLTVILFIYPTITFAQTEVEGEVSGVWDTDGSPYILIDDATVPEDESLTIEPGVEVEFGEDLTLTVNGQISAVGTEEDTIRFHGPEGVRSGILMLVSEEDTARFGYCRFDSLERALKSWEMPVDVTHSMFWNCRWAFELPSFWIRISHCIFQADSTDQFIDLGHNRRNERVHTNEVIFTDNITRGLGGMSVWDTGELTVRQNVAQEHRRKERCYVSVVGCSEVLFENNINFGIRLNNGRYRALEEAIIEDNMNSWISIYHSGRTEVVVQRNDMNRLIVSYSQVEVTNNRFRRFLNYPSETIDLNEAAIVRFERNFLPTVKMTRGPWGEPGDYDLQFINNTFVYEGDYAQYKFIDARNNDIRINLLLFNNIFFSHRQTEYAVSPGIEISEGGYNCIFGPENAYGERDDLLEGDISEFPIFVGGHPYEYHLQANSPCIDAGDPDADEDPDGTRADIGAFYYDQENGMPPAIISQHDMYTGWGMEFRYAAIATDMDGAIEFEFEGLPEWLEVEDDGRRDFVSDSVVVSGEVPEEQEDFVFVVTASDEDGLEDTLSVQVFVYPMTVLTGRIGGVLSADDGPYLVADTAWVEEGDSLIFEPGCQIFADNRFYEGRYTSNFQIYGKLCVIGTEEDSIYINRWQPGTPGGDIFLLHGDPGEPTEFRYCRFGRSSIRTWNRDIIITNCQNDSGGYVIGSRGGQRGRYLFANNRGRGGLFSGTGFIHENNLRGGIGVMGGDSTRINSNHLSKGDIYVGENLRFCEIGYNVIDTSSGSRAITLRGNNTIAESNVIKHCSNGISISGSVSAFNNIINNAQFAGLLLYPTFEHSIAANNVISNSMVGYNMDPLIWNPDYENVTVVNNLFMNDSILIRTNQRGINFSDFIYNNSYEIDSISNDTTEIGILTRTNTNDDSCDAGFNIFLEPQIVSLDSLDFHLYAGSPLIDAGNSDSIFNDLDGSINDIGLFGGPYGESYDYPEGVGESDISPPVGFTLSAPHPNPFNSQVQLTFTLPGRGDIEVRVYDVTGRQVFRSHITGAEAGCHRYLWRGEDSAGRASPTGIYYFELSFHGAKLVRPMVMVK